MRLLLDTQALLIWIGDVAALPRVARAAVQDPAATVLVSIASLWEANIKRAIGKLQFPDALDAILDECGFQLLPVTLPHLAELSRLPLHHRDPFDRLLVAQAIVEAVPIVTGDPQIARYGVRVVW